MKANKKAASGTLSSLGRLLTSAELSAVHWAWEGAPGPKAGTPETPGRVQPHSLLRESVTGRRASQELGLLHRYRPCFISPDEGLALRHTLVPPTTTGNQDAAGGVERSPAVPPTTTGPPPGAGP